MKINFFSLKWKIAFWFIFIGFITSVGIGSYAINQQTEVLKKNEISRLTNLLNQKTQNLENYLKEIQVDLKETSQRYSLQNLIEAIPTQDEEEIEFWLEPVEKDFMRLANFRKRYSRIQIIDESGNELMRVDYENGNALLTSQENLKKSLKDEIFKSTMKLYENQIGIVSLLSNHRKSNQSAFNEPLIQFGTPLFTPGGVRLGTLIFTAFGKRFLNTFGEVPSGKILLADETGYIFYPEFSSDLERKNFLPLDQNKSLNTAMYKQEAGTILEHATKIISHKKLRYGLDNANPHWLAIYMDERESVLKPVLDLRDKSLMILIVILTLVIALALIFARKLTHPLKRVVSIAEEISKGNLKQTKLGYISNDEIGQLANSFDSMLESLNRVVHQAEDVAAGKLNKDYNFQGDLKEAFTKMVFGLKAKERAEDTIIKRTNDLKIANVELMNSNKQLNELFQEMKQTKEEMEKAKEEAVKANKAKSLFLANMSHEIRTPLNAITGFSNILYKLYKQDRINEKFEEYLEIILKSGSNLTEVINNILDLSKIESGKMETTKETMDLKVVVKGLNAIFKNSMTVKGISFNYYYDDEIPNSIYSDRVKLNQILTNLLGNAQKFTDTGKVELKVQKENGSILFSVTDTGIGIPSDKLGSIFNIFEQVDGSMTRDYGGSGLGLALTKKMAERLGGEIWVESQVKKGSSFYFRLPIEVDNQNGTEYFSLESKAALSK
jgi:signal transduction histidine kinase